MTTSTHHEPSLSQDFTRIAPHNVLLGGESKLLHVMRMLDHPDPNVEQKALFRLADMSNTSRSPEAGKNAVERLVHAALFDQRWHVYYLSARLLSLLDDPSYAIRLLQAALKRRDPALRTRSIRVLEKIKDTQSLDVFIQALNDSSPEVRAAAAKALGKVGDTQSVRSLIISLTDADSDVSVQAANSLGLLGSAAAVDPLINLYSIGNEHQRRAGINALKKLMDERSKHVFLHALDEPDWRIRKYAVEGISNLGKPDDYETAYALYQLLSDPVSSVREEAAALLENMGNGTNPPPHVYNDLIAGVRTHPEAYARALMIRVLGRTGGPYVADILIEALSDPVFSVQRAAARTLERVGSYDALEAVNSWRRGIY